MDVTCNPSAMSVNIAFLYIAVGLLLNVVSCIALYRRRKMYPLLERSPLVTIFATISLYISTLGLPITLIVDKLQQSEDSIVYGVAMYLSFCAFMYFFAYQLLKFSRLLFVVNARMPNRTLVHVLKNEKLISWGVFLLLTIMSLTMMSFVDFDYLDTFGNSLVAFKEQEIFPWLFCSLGLLVTAYFLRQLKTSYQIQKECLLLFAYQYLLSLYSAATDFIELSDCLLWVGTFSVRFLYFILYMLVSIWLPISRSQPYHEQLSPSIILENFRLFVQDKQCLQVFDEYLTYLDKRANSRLELQQQWHTLKTIHTRTNNKLHGIQTRGHGQYSEGQKEFFNLIHTLQPKRLDPAVISSTQSQQSASSTGSGRPESYFYRNLFGFYLDVLKEYIRMDGDLSTDACVEILQEYFLGDGLLRNESQPRTKEPKLRKIKSSPDRIKEVELDNEEKGLINRVAQMINRNQYDLIVQIVMEYFSVTEDYLQSIYQFWYLQTDSYEALSSIMKTNERITQNLFMLNMTCCTIKEIFDDQSNQSNM